MGVVGDALGLGVEVCLRVVGVPPRAAVVAWEEATAYGQPLTMTVPPLQLSTPPVVLLGLEPPMLPEPELDPARIFPATTQSAP